MDIVSICEEWARWLHQRGSTGWPSKTQLGKCLEDMPSTTCTLCQGKGKIRGALIHTELDFVHCPRCAGQGRVKIESTQTKINPALISATEKHGHIPKIQFNLLAHNVDLIVNELKKTQKEVVFIEYREPGSQHKKAKILKIPQQTYSWRLQQAHKKITNYLQKSW